MSVLLDVNVLIALIDPAHINHQAAHRWFSVRSGAGWATCPIVENGCVRIVSNPRYPNPQALPRTVVAALSSLRSIEGFEFWQDTLCLVDDPSINGDAIQSSGQVTDTYLLALAASRGGRLASFDRKLVTTAVVNGARTLELISP